MKKPKQMNAGINPDLATKLQMRLLKEGCSYRQWLEDRIVEYLNSRRK